MSSEFSTHSHFLLCVSTVGLDEETIRQYIRDQEQLEKQQQDFDFESLLSKKNLKTVFGRHKCLISHVRQIRM